MLLPPVMVTCCEKAVPTVPVLVATEAERVGSPTVTVTVAADESPLALLARIWNVSVPRWPTFGV